MTEEQLDRYPKRVLVKYIAQYAVWDEGMKGRLDRLHIACRDRVDVRLVMNHKAKVREITGRKNLHAVKAFIARAEEELRNGSV